MTTADFFRAGCWFAVALNLVIIVRATVSIGAILLVGKRPIRGKPIFDDDDIATFGCHIGQLMSSIAVLVLIRIGLPAGFNMLDVAFEAPLATAAILSLWLSGIMVQGIHKFPRLFVRRSEWTAE